MTELASPGQLRASFLRWALVLVPGIVLLGFVSGRMAQSGPGNPWFAALVKPDIYPPPAAFGIVWTILYILMGLALAMIVTARGAPGRGLAIGVFAVQLLLNLVWSPLFFGMQQITYALYLLFAIDVAVLATVALFWRVRPLAGAMLLPYLAWVLFATLLNWQFLEANPGADGPLGGGEAVQTVEFK
ncbi:TspO/MBR family protein [Novosphingobium sp.]|uniref:TspO/MBR family protein n=1 Tax=Novosphingobium sp. TaxID=1874826 RepID=UPI001EBA0DD3|nr:TspO/MBR family protein [Novosphingobium sp.]MBK6801621.1 tryptophan-rich sensory protein [Novosphingobium sp.]MBK9010479.1 tryptophan-rich sensory protein [Novosphingobium sp.]